MSPEVGELVAALPDLDDERQVEPDRLRDALALPLRLGRGWEPVKAQLEEVRRVIDQETDYLREAEPLDSTNRRGTDPYARWCGRGEAASPPNRDQHL